VRDLKGSEQVWIKFRGKNCQKRKSHTPAIELVLRAIQGTEKGGEDFDSVPEVLETQVFVGGVLIVVVVRDGEGDHGNVATLLK